MGKIFCGEQSRKIFGVIRLIGDFVNSQRKQAKKCPLVDESRGQEAKEESKRRTLVERSPEI